MCFGIRGSGFGGRDDATRQVLSTARCILPTPRDGTKKIGGTRNKAWPMVGYRLAEVVGCKGVRNLSLWLRTAEQTEQNGTKRNKTEQNGTPVQRLGSRQ